MSEYLTTEEVAAELKARGIKRVSPRTVRDWIKAGRLKATRLGGDIKAPLYVPRSELERLLRGGEDNDKGQKSAPVALAVNPATGAGV